MLASMLTDILLFQITRTTAVLINNLGAKIDNNNNNNKIMNVSRIN